MISSSLLKSQKTTIVGENFLTCKGSQKLVAAKKNTLVAHAQASKSKNLQSVDDLPLTSPPPFRSSSFHLKDWSVDSWQKYNALQQPEYPDQDHVDRSLESLSQMPPLVFAGECRNLQEQMAKAAKGETFVLMGGDCAEAFSQFQANRIRDTYRVIIQMALVMVFGGGQQVTKIGRMAGQFAKPRSSPVEKQNGTELPAYRGDIINSQDFDPKSRIPNPERLIQAYNQSAATLNLIRGFSTGGYASLERATQWSLDFMKYSKRGQDFIDLAARIEESVEFMKACGLKSEDPIMKYTDFYIAHEALLLQYEQALTREDSTTGLMYDCSGHFLWIGERTRQLDGAHIEFFKGIANPIGIKISDKCQTEELLKLIDVLNPENVPGRLSIITRMSAGKLREHLPRYIEAVRENGKQVTWITDPMHGNTESLGGYKTRRFENVLNEILAFFEVHQKMGTIPGGIHLEMTGENVTECLGGGASIHEADISNRYHTHCDPRLNAEQALEIAFNVADRLRSRRKLSAAKKNLFMNENVFFSMDDGDHGEL